jgi:ligand-binding sensor domain-containing protein
MRTDWLIPALLASMCCAWGKIPIKVYTIDDGLPRNKILRVVADPRGLLWFCTSEGLSRFDGSYFTNYGAADGLPSPQVNDFLVTRGGTYWVATSAGLARFEPKSVAASRFLAHASHLRQVSRLFQDAAGNLWIAAESGVYRMPRPDAPAPAQPEPVDSLRGISAVALAEASDRSMWLGVGAPFCTSRPPALSSGSERPTDCLRHWSPLWRSMPTATFGPARIEGYASS